MQNKKPPYNNFVDQNNYPNYPHSQNPYPPLPRPLGQPLPAQTTNNLNPNYVPNSYSQDPTQTNQYQVPFAYGQQAPYFQAPYHPSNQNFNSKQAPQYPPFQNQAPSSPQYPPFQNQAPSSPQPPNYLNNKQYYGQNLNNVPAQPRNPFYESDFSTQRFTNPAYNYQNGVSYPTQETVITSKIQKKINQLESLYYEKVISLNEYETKKRELIKMEKEKFKI